jgi:hypothetical protein
LQKDIEMWHLQVSNLGDNRHRRGNPCPQAFEEGITFRKLGDVNSLLGVFSKQGKKVVVKLETAPSIMAEFEDVECCTVPWTKLDIVGFVVGIAIVVVLVVVANCCGVAGS